MYDPSFLSLNFSFQNCFLWGFYFKVMKKFIIIEKTFSMSLILSMTHKFVDPVGYFLRNSFFFFSFQMRSKIPVYQSPPWGLRNACNYANGTSSPCCWEKAWAISQAGISWPLQNKKWGFFSDISQSN